MASEMHKFMRERGVKTLRVPESLEVGHLHMIGADAVIGPIPAIPDGCAGGGKKPLGMVYPLNRITCLGFRRGTLDITGGDRRRRPRPSHQRGIIWTVRITWAGAICRQTAVGDAVRVRWSRRETRKQRD